MKKINAIFCALCAAALLFAACGSSVPPVSSGDSESSGEPVALRFSWWGGDARHEATLAAIAAYSAQYPNVTIEGEFQGYDGYEEKIATQIAGNTAPDIIQLTPARAKEFGSKNEIFVDFYDQDIVDLSGFEKTFIENFGMEDGKLFGLPTGINSYNVLFNKKVTDSIGMTIPDDLTWESFFELGRELHARDANLYLLTGDRDGFNLILRSYIRQTTGEWFVRDDYTICENREAYIAGYRLIRRMFDEGVAEPMDSAYHYYGKMHENKKWLTGEIGCQHGAASSIPQLAGDGMEITTRLIPSVENPIKTGIVTLPSQMLGVAKRGNEREALKFIQYFYNDPQAIDILKDCRGIPPTSAARERLEQAGSLDPVISGAIEMALAKTDDPIPLMSEHSEIYRVCFDVMEQVCFGAITPEQAADMVMNGCRQVLSELKAAQ